MFRPNGLTAIAPMTNGDLICRWRSGSGGEPATGTSAPASRSTDGGTSGSEPSALMAAGKDATTARCKPEAEALALPPDPAGPATPDTFFTYLHG